MTATTTARATQRRSYAPRVVAAVFVVAAIALIVFVFTPLHSALVRGPFDVATASYDGNSTAMAFDGMLSAEVRHGTACFWVTADDGSRRFVTWPSGSSAAERPELVALDQWGTPLATSGTAVTLAYEWTGQLPPPACA